MDNKLQNMDEISEESINQGSFGFEIFDVNNPVKYNSNTYNLIIYACHYKDYGINIKILS